MKTEIQNHWASPIQMSEFLRSGDKNGRDELWREMFLRIQKVDSNASASVIKNLIKEYFL